MSIVRSAMPAILAVAVLIGPTVTFAKPVDKADLRGSSLPTSSTAWFQQSFEDALGRLRGDPGCLEFFGVGADHKLIGATFRFAPLGAARLDSNGDPKITGAATFVDDNLIMINSEGNFMTQSVFVPGRSAMVRFDGRTGLRGVAYSALVILHELGHLVGKFDPDSPGAWLSPDKSPPAEHRGSLVP